MVNDGQFCTVVYIVSPDRVNICSAAYLQILPAQHLRPVEQEYEAYNITVATDLCKGQSGLPETLLLLFI